MTQTELTRMKAWITKDEFGTIKLSMQEKPVKSPNILYGTKWFNRFGYCVLKSTDLPEGINPQWSDDEPIEVELKIEKV